jgi:hypothetical protein
MITSFEVLKYSGAGRDYPTALFCGIIPQVEQEFVRQCLGNDLWAYLKTKLTPTPTNVSTWQSCDVYMDGDTVNYFGNLFVSTEDNNTVVPDSDTPEWSAFSRFTDEGCNFIWDNYLVFILALKVFERTLVRSTHKATAGGVIVNTGDNTGFRSGNKAEIERYKSELERDIQTNTTNLVEWLNNNADTYSLPTATLCGQSGCNTKGSVSRKWNFRREKTILNTEWT